MNKWLSIIAAACVAASVYGQNNVLAQLGARGTTVNAGTSAYRDYIVRLGADGRFSMTVMPQGLAPSVFTRLVYIDHGSGIDGATATGSVTQPYKTIGFAAAAFTGTQQPIVYLLQPGDYGNVTLDPLTLPGITNFVVCGYGQDSTYIPELEFESAGAGAAVTVTLSGVRVGRLAQRNSKAMTVRLRDSARVDVLQMAYGTACTVTREADSVIGTFQGSQPYSETLVATAAGIGFYFDGNLYTNVNNALNYLLTKDRIAIWVSAWDTNAWSSTAATWTNSPAFGITDADTNAWSSTAATWTNSPAFGITDADANAWSSTAATWTNSVAFGITVADTNAWAYGVGTWTNSVAFGITVADTNAWAYGVGTWTNSPAFGITDADTNAWSYGVGTWTNSPAFGITQDDVNTWYLLAIGGTNNLLWTITALEWSNSVAKAISATDTQRWTQAYHMTVMSNLNGRVQSLENQSNIWHSTTTIVNSYTNAWTKPIRLWSTNTSEDTVRWLELDVTADHEDLVLYETRTTQLDSWTWYVIGYIQIYGDYDPGTGEWTYNTIWSRSSPYAVSSWPKYLSLGDTIQIPGDVVGQSPATVGAGSFYYTNGGEYLMGVGISADGRGLLLNYGGQPPELSLFSGATHSNGTVLGSDEYMTGFDIYRIDEPPITVVTTNELNRFTGTDELSRVLYARDRDDMYVDLTNGHLRVVQPGIPHIVTNTEYMTVTLVDAKSYYAPNPVSTNTTVPIIPGGDGEMVMFVVDDVTWSYGYNDTADPDICELAVYTGEFASEWVAAPQLPAPQCYDVLKPLWQQLPLTLTPLHPATDTGHVILSNIVDTVYTDSVLFSVDLSAYPGFKLAGTENSWIEFDTTNLMRKVVTQVGDTTITNTTPFLPAYYSGDGYGITASTVTGNTVVATSALVAPTQWLYIGPTNTVNTWRMGVDPSTHSLIIQRHTGTDWTTVQELTP